MTSSEHTINHRFKTIENIITKYKDNESMLEKVNKYIDNLPKYMECIENNKRKKEEQNTRVSECRNQIINSFVHEPFTHYFYIQSSTLFISYNGVNYQVISGDEISSKLNSVLVTNNLSHNSVKKFRSYIIRYIKKQSLLSSIPESKTIQNVISFL